MEQLRFVQLAAAPGGQVMAFWPRGPPEKCGTMSDHIIQIAWKLIHIKFPSRRSAKSNLHQIIN
jgi:hypothetical protein